MSTKRRRVLAVGVGSIGERHVRCFQRTGRCDVAICEVQPELRDRIAKQYDINAAYENLSDAAADPFDAVVICTPAHHHVPMAVDSLRAGRHVLIEKPLSVSLDRVDELAELVAAAELEGTIVGVAYVNRAHPTITAMKREFDSGRFGRLLELIAVSGQHFPLYRPAYRDIYYRDRATGGGAIQDALTHTINLGEWFAGPVYRAIADAEHLALDGVDVEDTVHVLARHAGPTTKSNAMSSRRGDVLASYSLNQHQAPNETTLTLVCEQGTLRYQAHRNAWQWMTEPGTEWRDEPGERLERDDLFVRQANLFLDAIDAGVSPACSFADGLQTLRVNLALLRSLETRRWEEVVKG